jgi:hypothetical protein
VPPKLSKVRQDAIFYADGCKATCPLAPSKNKMTVTFGELFCTKILVLYKSMNLLKDIYVNLKGFIAI